MRMAGRVLVSLITGLCFMSFLPAQKEGSGPDKAKTPVVVLGGLDPVSLLDGKKEKGREDFSVVREGFKYLFTSSSHREAFVSKPEKYAVQDDGNDPVARVNLKREIKGEPSIFAVHEGRIYLFASSDSHKTFEKNPQAYIKAKKKEGSGPQD